MVSKYFIAVLFSLTLASCGFQPIYGNSDLGKRLSQIRIGNISYQSKIPTREAITLKSALEHELNWSYTDSPKNYTLDVSYLIAIEGSAIQSNALATRNNLRVTLTYTLTDDKNGKIIESNKLIGVESFDIPASPFSNYVSKEETAIRVMKSLATELKLRLTAFV